MSDVLISQALETQLNSLPGKPDLVWENIEYTSTIGTPFIRVVYQPVSETPGTIGTNPVVCHKGIFSLNLFYPANTGAKAARQMADAIRDHFTPGLELVAGGVRVIIRRCERVTSPANDGVWYQIPVTITWIAYV